MSVAESGVTLQPGSRLSWFDGRSFGDSHQWRWPPGSLHVVSPPPRLNLTSLPRISAAQRPPPAFSNVEGRFSTSPGAFSVLSAALCSLNGHTIIVPQQALDRVAFITLRQPSTPFVEVEVRVNGRDHFEFQGPVTVVLDYSRCPDWRIGPEPLTVWQIDPDTKAFIADMGGVDDRAARKISFTTDHFSGYAVAQ